MTEIEEAVARVGMSLVDSQIITAYGDGRLHAMTLLSTIRQSLGPSYRMKSDREIAHIVVSVLGAVREPSAKALKAAFVEMNKTPSGTWKAMKADNATPRALFDAKMTPRWSAMIDALIEEVTAEAGR